MKDKNHLLCLPYITLYAWYLATLANKKKHNNFFHLQAEELITNHPIMPLVLSWNNSSFSTRLSIFIKGNIIVNNEFFEENIIQTTCYTIFSVWDTIEKKNEFQLQG
jgi:hypothetical protein